MPVVFALDIGEKRIGIAKSDELEIIASPFGFIEREGSVEKLKNIFELENAEKVVIGMPYLPSGGLGSQSNDVLKFVNEFKQTISLPTIFENEVLSSVEAEKRLNETKNSFEKGDIDVMAAVILLESYLRRENHA